MWTYRCYDDGRPGCPWRRWYDENPEYQGSHDAVFETLEGLDNWTKPEVDFLDKDNRLVEVRLRGRVRHRILGFHAGTRHEFTIVGFCYHKQTVYTPTDIKKTAIKRKKAIENDPTLARICNRPE